MKISAAASIYFLFQCKFQIIAGDDTSGDDGIMKDEDVNKLLSDYEGGVLNSTNDKLFPYLPPEEDQGGSDEDSLSGVGNNKLFPHLPPEEDQEGSDEDTLSDLLHSLDTLLESEDEDGEVDSLEDGEWSTLIDFGGADSDNDSNENEENFSGILEGLQDQALGVLEMLPPQLLQCVGMDDSGNPFDDASTLLKRKQCSEEETTTFKQQISKFDQCSGWDMVQLIETIPSIYVGNFANCFNVLLADEGDVKQEDIQQCKDSFLGVNPFGSVIHDLVLNSDNICSCYKHLHESPLPECTLDHWPIPISGKGVNSFACILSFGCQFADLVCEFEQDSLQTCMPKSNEDFTCEGVIEKCNQNDSMLFFDPNIQIPLPGACRRVYATSGESKLVERYDNFSGKCLKETMDVWNTHVDFKTSGSNDHSTSTAVQFKEAKEITSMMKMDESPSEMKSTNNNDQNEKSSNDGSKQIWFTVVAFLGGIATTFIAISISNKRGKNMKGRYGAIKEDLPELPPI